MILELAGVEPCRKTKLGLANQPGEEQNGGGGGGVRTHHLAAPEIPAGARSLSNPRVNPPDFAPPKPGNIGSVLFQSRLVSTSSESGSEGTAHQTGKAGGRGDGRPNEPRDAKGVEQDVHRSRIFRTGQRSGCWEHLPCRDRFVDWDTRVDAETARPGSRSSRASDTRSPPRRRANTGRYRSKRRNVQQGRS